MYWRTMMQSFILMALVTILWAFFGYSLVFHEGNRLLEVLDISFLHGVGAAPDPDYAGTIPQQTFMVYQLMFAIITPALITGAFAERMKFKAMLVFMVAVVVYRVCADGTHGLGQRRPFECLSGRRDSHLGFCRRHGGACDFGGFGAGVRVVSGKTPGISPGAMPPHSVVLSVIGACLLWVGWFGFNAGSALSAGSLATSAFVATHFGAAAAAWAGPAEWFVNGKASVLGAISGAVAGLVAITPAAGFRRTDVGPGDRISCRAWSAISWCQGQSKFGYDDSLDAFGVHGAGGTLGAILTGVFASRAINPIFKDAHGNALPVGWLTATGCRCPINWWAWPLPGRFPSWERWCC